MRKQAIFTEGSPWPASIGSRLKLFLKYRKSRKEPTDLRWRVRVLEISAEDLHSPKVFSTYFFNQPSDYICFDIGRGEVLNSWIELPGAKEEDGTRLVERRSFSSFDKIVWVGENTAANCTLPRVQLPILLTVRSMWKLVTDSTIPGVKELATILGVSVACIVERRSRVLLGDSSADLWFLIDMPEVVYFIMDSVLSDEYHSRPENGVSVADAVAAT